MSMSLLTWYRGIEMADIKSFEPELLWKHFDEIRKIPRCSKHEEKIRDYIRDFAVQRNLDWKEDSVGNIVIKKPASRGCEEAPGVVLQQHVDMVCEKNSATIHDFSKDPIQLDIRDGWLYAKGTSLGADNGIGVACSLAVLDSSDIIHGSLEALFTVDEETGLTGAFALQPDFLEGRTLLNLDSEDEGVIYVGCAGGGDVRLSREYGVQDSEGEFFSLSVAGLKGGHSGIDIYKGRANAVKLLARILLKISEECELSLVSMSGGDKHNAIPREAEAVFAVQCGLDIDKIVDNMKEDIIMEFGTVETGLDVELSTSEGGRSIALDNSKRFLAILNNIPHGVARMSPDIPGLVETSNNLASASLDNGYARIYCSTRSSISGALEALRRSIKSLGEIEGFTVEMRDSYPGWKPDMDSALLKVANNVHTKCFGREAEIKAVHAGLETGIVGEKYPGMDMISIGPQIEHPHSPEERVHIESCERFWVFLKSLMKEVAEEGEN